MTDQQFQPGQPNPPTQGGGVFGGNSEEIIHDPSMFGSLGIDTEPVEETVDSNKSPFDGFTLPQDMPKEPVFAGPEVKIPEINIEEKVPVVAPVVAEVAQPAVAPIIEKAIEPVVEDKIEETPVIEEAKEVEKEIIEEVKPIEKVAEKQSDEKASDIQQKFNTLSNNVSELNSILRLKNGEVIEIVGSKNDKLSVLYQFGLNDQKEINVKRIETDKDEDETSFNELKLSLNSDSNLIEIFLDDVLLFEESDLLEDARKKSQVIEKINKFIFLTESKLKDVQKELKAKQEEEEERRRLQDIFRNF